MHLPPVTSTEPGDGRVRSRRLLAAAFVAVLSVWNLALVAAPYGVRHADAPETARLASLGVYWMGQAVCHQRPERSFHLLGTPVPVCARCHGLYAAALVGAFCALLMGTGPSSAARLQGMPIRPALVWSAFPLAGSVALEWAGLWMAPGWARAASAAPFGAIVAFIVGATIRGYLR